MPSFTTRSTRSRTKVVSQEEVLPILQKPKRPLSAYNLFFQAKRGEILKSTPTRPEGKPRRSHGKIGFAELARKIAGEWKAIDEETRIKYDKLATEDKKRYMKEMDEWKAKRNQSSKLVVPVVVESREVEKGESEIQKVVVKSRKAPVPIREPKKIAMDQPSLHSMLRQGHQRSRLVSIGSSSPNAVDKIDAFPDTMPSFKELEVDRSIMAQAFDINVLAAPSTLPMSWQLEMEEDLDDDVFTQAQRKIQRVLEDTESSFALWGDLDLDDDGPVL